MYSRPDPYAQSQLSDTRNMSLIKRSANWCYWVAGLTVINLITAWFKLDFNFSFGLAFATVIEAFAVATKSMPIMIVGAIICLALALGFGFLGIFASKGQKWAFIVAIVVLLLDTALIVAAVKSGALLTYVVRAWALFELFKGLKES